MGRNDTFDFELYWVTQKYKIIVFLEEHCLVFYFPNSTKPYVSLWLYLLLKKKINLVNYHSFKKMWDKIVTSENIKKKKYASTHLFRLLEDTLFILKIIFQFEMPFINNFNLIFELAHAYCCNQHFTVFSKWILKHESSKCWKAVLLRVFFFRKSTSVEFQIKLKEFEIWDFEVVKASK